MLAPVGVEHDLGLGERGGVIVEAPDLDRLRRHEAVAVGDVAGHDAVDGEGHDIGRVVRAPKVHRIECSGRTQRNASGRAEAAPQRIDFGQGKARMIAGTISASTSRVARPGRSMTAT